MINYSKCRRKILIPITLIAFLLSFQNSYTQDTPKWVAESNRHTKVLLDIISKYNPESTAAIGVDGFDDQIIDLSAGFSERYLQDLKQSRVYLKSQLEQIEDDPIRQDLQILIESIDNEIEEIHLNEANLLPYYKFPWDVWWWNTEY